MTEDSSLLIDDAVSLGRWLPMSWGLVFILRIWAIDHSVVSQNAWIFISTALKVSCLVVETSYGCILALSVQYAETPTLRQIWIK